MSQAREHWLAIGSVSKAARKRLIVEAVVVDRQWKSVLATPIPELHLSTKDETGSAK